MCSSLLLNYAGETSFISFCKEICPDYNVNKLNYFFIIIDAEFSPAESVFMKTPDAETLDQIYSLYNRRELIHPDPLEFPADIKDIRDREITGLVAACLAYGRVAMIIKNVSAVLTPMEGKPADFIESHTEKDFKKLYSDFKHRFTTGQEMAFFLSGIKDACREYGSLENCFADGFDDTAETVHQALSAFTARLRKFSQGKNSLLPDPSLKSPCKRLHLFLRWMIRKDDVDPGGWNPEWRSKLIVPLDTHMFHFGKFYGFTSRKNADIETAMEITSGFRKICPEDPVKYDFALTRFGIRYDMNWGDLDRIIDERKNQKS